MIRKFGALIHSPIKPRIPPSLQVASPVFPPIYDRTYTFFEYHWIMEEVIFRARFFFRLFIISIVSRKWSSFSTEVLEIMRGYHYTYYGSSYEPTTIQWPLFTKILTSLKVYTLQPFIYKDTDLVMSTTYFSHSLSAFLS